MKYQTRSLYNAFRIERIDVAGCVNGAKHPVERRGKAVKKDEVADHEGAPFVSPNRAVSFPESRSFSCPGKPNQSHFDRKETLPDSWTAAPMCSAYSGMVAIWG